MILKKIAIWLMCCMFGMAAVAQTRNTAIESGDTRIEVLGQNYAHGVRLGKGQARMVVYSLEEGRLQGATSVFVNGSYHASLIKGAFSDLCYRPGEVELGARQVQAGQRPKDGPDTITATRLVGGQTHYLRVREQDGRPVLFPVSAAQAMQELPTKRLQLHTISRVAQDCIEAPPAPETTAPEQHTLAVDTLFAFARSDRQGMTEAGLAAIDQLMTTLRKDYSRIHRLHIVGHADPLGDVGFNERLSVERANTVRQRIESLGQFNLPITSEGRGAREPVVTGCGQVATPQAQACNQPNRRVVIEVTGSRL